ncbi:hypothetical protein EDB92DRAFT_2105691, partial [Lactarius akahatsu]
MVAWDRIGRTQQPECNIDWPEPWGCIGTANPGPASGEPVTMISHSDDDNHSPMFVRRLAVQHIHLGTRCDRSERARGCGAGIPRECPSPTDQAASVLKDRTDGAYATLTNTSLRRGCADPTHLDFEPNLGHQPRVAGDGQLVLRLRSTLGHLRFINKEAWRMRSLVNIDFGVGKGDLVTDDGQGLSRHMSRGYFHRRDGNELEIAARLSAGGFSSYSPHASELPATGRASLCLEPWKPVSRPLRRYGLRHDQHRRARSGYQIPELPHGIEIVAHTISLLDGYSPFGVLNCLPYGNGPVALNEISVGSSPGRNIGGTPSSLGSALLGTIAPDTCDKKPRQLETHPIPAWGCLCIYEFRVIAIGDSRFFLQLELFPPLDAASAMLLRGLCLLGQRAMTLCRGALGLSEPTWYIRLPPVSEDEGQYSMPRGGQGQVVSSGFEPAKVLVRGLPLPRPLRLPRPFREPTSLTTYQGSWPSIARRGATPGGLVAIGVSITRIFAIHEAVRLCLVLLHSPFQSPLSTSSSNFDTIFKTAFKAYKKQTGHDITSHPLAAWLKTCDSPDAVLAVLKAQVEEFDQSRRDDERLTKWLNPTVNVLYAFSGTLGEGVGLVFSPAKVIFAGIGVLLLASKDVAASHEVLINIFERIENFFKRLEAYTEVPQTAAMTDVIVRIMVEVLSIFAIATKEIKQGFAKKFVKKLVGRRDIEDALQKLDRLTQEEARMATAEVLRVTHGVDDKVKGVGFQVEGVNKVVHGVGEGVQRVDHKVQAVDDRVKQVNDRVGVVNDDVKLIVEGGKERTAAIQRIVNTIDDMNRNQLRR